MGLGMVVGFQAAQAGESLAHCDYQQIVQSQEPLAYYRFSDEVLPGVSLQNQGSVTITNQLFYPARWSSLSEGALGDDRAARFAGVGIRADYAQELNPWPCFTVEVWAQYGGAPSEKTGYGCPIGNFSRSLEGGRGWAFYATEDARWEFHLGGEGNGDCILQGAQARLEEWVYLVAVYDGALAQLYVNGALADSAVFYGALPNPKSQRWGIGCRGDGFCPWTGGLDEIALHAQALSSEEIARHYSLRSEPQNYEKALLALNPRVYWRMNEEPLEKGVLNSAPGADLWDRATYENGAAPSASGPRYGCFEPHNRAVSLTNRSDYIEVNGEALLPPSPSWTLSGWFRPMSKYPSPLHPTLEVLFSQTLKDQEPEDFKLFLRDEGYLTYSLKGEVALEPGVLLTKDVWHFLALVVRPEGATLWVSEPSDELTSLKSAIPHGPMEWKGRFRWGASAVGYVGIEDFNFNGELDEWCLWGRALSPGEVKQQFYCAWPGIPPELFGVTRVGQASNPTLAQVGEPIVLRADAAGSLPLCFRWFCNGILLQEGPEDHVQYVCDVPGASERFQVIVSNTEGTISSEFFEIQVQATQEQPQLHFTWKEGYLELDWKGGTLCSFTDWGAEPEPVGASVPPLRVLPSPGEKRFYIVLSP